MFGLKFKLIAAAVLLAIIGGLIAVQHITQRKLVAANARANQAEANYIALREAQKHEREISQKASTDYENRLKALADASSLTPVRTVRLCRQTNSSVSATASATSGTDAGTAAEQPGTAGSDLEAGPDIGVELYALADEADQRAAQCNALIGWVRSR